MPSSWLGPPLAVALAAIVALPVIAEEPTPGKPKDDTAAQDLQPAGPAQEGEASWYGEDFEGKATASGEPFDPDDLTAAHRELPLGSKAEVTNLETGESVTVEINDRGPYAKGREIDLSKEAAEQLDIVEEGEAEVRIQPVE